MMVSWSVRSSAVLGAVVGALVLPAAPAAAAPLTPVGFGPPATYPVGADTNPVSVAPGDFNRDGDVDLVVADQNTDTVGVVLGDGAGGFGPATNFAVGAAPFSVAVGDFDGDGDPDAAVANSGSDTVSVLLGNGAGGFGLATNFGVGGSPDSVAVGDFDGDRRPDLAVVSLAEGAVSVLLGDGAGGFGPATDFPVGFFPFSVAVGDFNGDRRPDLATADLFSGTVSVLLGNGAGGFGPATAFPVGAFPLSVAVGDFNKDGDADLAVPSLVSDSVSVLMGDGAGGFAPATQFAAGSGPVAAVVADFNLDADPDVGVVDFGSGEFLVLAGDGSGGFAPAVAFDVGPAGFSAAIADFNRDGLPDVATTNGLPLLAQRRVRGAGDLDRLLRRLSPSSIGARAADDGVTVLLNTTIQVRSLTPSSGPTSGGTPVVIAGSGLTGATGVRFGELAGVGAAATATRLAVATPASESSGPRTVWITFPGGRVSAGVFTYQPPMITLLDPASGPETGGTLVTITGTGLVSASAVRFGGRAAILVGEPTDNRLTVRAPTHAAGRVTVVVTLRGQDARRVDGFTFQAVLADTGVRVWPVALAGVWLIVAGASMIRLTRHDAGR